MYTEIICDIGGILITPSEKITPYILSEMFHIPLEAAVQSYTAALPQLRTGKLSVMDMARKISEKYPQAAVIGDFETTYLSYYQKQALVNDDMMQLLEAVSQKCTLVAFSNMMDLHAKYNIRRGLFRYFHKVYLSSVTGLVKPDSDAFDLMIRDSGINPAETLYIDDQDGNNSVAAELGMTPYLFDSAVNIKGYLKKNGVL
jgi:HAD superfamily hydrolase (TIGR01509 family)